MFISGLKGSSARIRKRGAPGHGARLDGLTTTGKPETGNIADWTRKLTR